VVRCGVLCGAVLCWCCAVVCCGVLVLCCGVLWCAGAVLWCVRPGSLAQVRNHIKSSLRDVGKGWFNLKESNRELYDFSKLRRFLTMVNFLMQVCVTRQPGVTLVSLVSRGVAQVQPLRERGTGCVSVSSPCGLCACGCR
jgi:hypothetical protein